MDGKPCGRQFSLGRLYFLMNITVFGATGGTGRQLVGQILAAGCQAAAYARNPSKIGAPHGRLTTVQGEITDRAAVERAVGGSDAVISALGSRPGEDIRSRPLSRGMQNMLAAMRQAGVRAALARTRRRGIVPTGWGGGDPAEHTDWAFSLNAWQLSIYNMQ
jgi:NAD(P)-dependent dehydrogenase (short-subunit alcohol dehydrogenase family)